MCIRDRYGAYGNMSHLFTFMAIFASATYIMICAANIKDRWNEKGFKSFLQDKLLPLIAIAILVYMIVSLSLIHISYLATRRQSRCVHQIRCGRKRRCRLRCYNERTAGRSWSRPGLRRRLPGRRPRLLRCRSQT